MKLPISIKIILIIMLLLGGTSFFIAKESSDYFEQVIVKREELSNNAAVISLADQVKLQLTASYERANSIAAQMLKYVQEKSIQNLQPNTSSLEIDDLNRRFSKVSSLVSIEIYKITRGSPELIYRKLNDRFLESQKVSASDFDDLRRSLPFPVNLIATKNLQIRNSTLPKGPALLSLGFPVARGENDVISHVAIADFQLSLIQKPFTDPSPRLSFAIDENGDLLAHQDEQKTLIRQNMKTNPLVAKSVESALVNLQTRYLDPELNTAFIGAYQKIPAWNITVFTQTSEDIVHAPTAQIKRRTFYVAGLAMSGAMFFIFLFSMTLTNPIERLVKMARTIASGNFSVNAKSAITSQDEVRDLAVAFDDMTKGLKERDRFKSVFAKFNGTSVTEEVLRDSLQLGGTKRDVTILFSDIRGFTQFSDEHSAEEVVDLLNEYFAKMVRIVNKNGGIVDKFIGDSIMAVWGSPQSSVMDTHNALKACIEMRLALKEFNTQRKKKGLPDIYIGMGLHTGTAIAGKIGSTEQMEYTVVGDTVNMASRLESSTKIFGTDLLISNTVVEKVGQDFLMEPVGFVEVKGKKDPIKLFKVRGYRERSGRTVEVKTEYSDYPTSKNSDKPKVAS